MDIMNTSLVVAAMTCPSCIRHVTAALDDIEGVRSVEVRLREGLVHVGHAPSVRLADLISALADAGYDAHLKAA